MTAAEFDVIAPFLAEAVKMAVDRATAPLVARIITLESRPQPVAVVGPEGPRGPEGVAGAKGLDGANGRDGRDGVGTPGRDGKDGEKGLDGTNGKDGADGLGFDDMTVVQTGDRSVELRFTRGEVVKVFPVELPSVIYRDVFKDGQPYAPGDAVTWAGSLWIAKAATTSKPGLNTEASRAWTLAVKRGGDGRDGKPGPEGKAGPKGDRGEPGRHG